MNIGVPIGFLIAKIVDRVATSERCACGPKRIVRAGDKNLVSVIQECLHAKVDEFAYAIAGVDAVHVNVR